MFWTRFLFATLSFAAIGPAWAESDAELFELRDRLLPGECAMEGKTAAHSMNWGTLHAVPCRFTPQDVVMVFVWEGGDGLRPVSFPVAELDIPSVDDPDWSLQEVTMFSSTTLASSPVVEGEKITLSHRVAPGLGEGYILHRYRMENGNAVLTRVAFSFAPGYEYALWPANARPDRLPPVPLDLIGYSEMTVDTQIYTNPLEVVAGLKIDFPAHPEEGGFPRMNIQMTQRDGDLAMEIEEKGWADDSVAGQVFRVLMQAVDGGWRVTRMGKANLCVRGDLPKSAQPCP